jgi:hypothetical protein
MNKSCYLKFKSIYNLYWVIRYFFLPNFLLRKIIMFEISSECFCGNSYGKYGTGSGCDMQCSGNQSQICGGFYQNSIYEIRCKISTRKSLF